MILSLTARPGERRILPKQSPAPPAPSSSLRKDALLLTGGQVMFALSQGVIAAIIVKFAGVEALAVFGLALAISNPLYFLTGMGLRPIVAGDASSRFPFADCWRARLLTTAFAVLVMGLAGMLAGEGRGLSILAAFLLFAVVKSADAGFDLVYGWRQRQGETRAAAISMLARAALGPLAMVGGIHASGGALAGGLLAWAIAVLALLALTEARTIRAAASKEPRGAGAISVILKAWPLGLSVALAAFETAIPRYVIDWWMEPAALGFFTGVFFFFQAALVAGGALGNAASAHLGRAFAAGNARRFNMLLLRMSLLMAALSGVGVLAAVLVGGDLLSAMYTPAFAVYAPLLALLAVAATFRCIASILQFALIAAGRFRAPLQVHICLTVFTAALAIPLVTDFGLTGAGYSLIAVSAAQAFAYTIIIARLPWR